MTEKDIEDSKFGLENDVNWIALSVLPVAPGIHFIRA